LQSHILAFTQNGDAFSWAAAIQEISNGTVPTTPTLLTIAGVPTGIKVKPVARGYVVVAGGGNGQVVLFQSPDETSAVANATPGNTDGMTDSSASGYGTIVIRENVYTDTSARLRYSADGTLLHI
jgi:hypothetical protein